MGNLFSGLTSGSVAMSYYTRGIETAGHNIANAGTENYARQRVNVTENIPTNDGGMLVGSGVKVESITRLRDMFLDAQYTAQMPTLGYWETRVNNLTNLEYYSGQVDRGTFQTTLDQFWEKLQGVHLYPDVSTYRTTLLKGADTMIASLSKIRTQYDLFRSDLNDQVYDMVVEANNLIDEIALLCDEITAEQNRGGHPNDLLDRRDLLAARLCKLTGAKVGSSALDEGDGDYKIDLNGMLLVQGGAQLNCDRSAIKNVRHLVLVPMIGNNSYYDVQVEGNQYDHISDLNVASVVIERGTTSPANCSRNGLHELFVERISNGRTWQVGGAAGILDGGDREDTIYDATKALGINGSFSLQVGTAGVKASSKSYAATNGVILGQPVGDEATLHELRIAAGEFESTISIRYDSTAQNWSITSDDGTLLGTSAGPNLTTQELQKALDGYPELSATYDEATMRFEIEAANTDAMRGHLLSITDIRGTLAQDMGIANKNPAVEINVTEADSLQTIANKINAAYMSDQVSGYDPETGGYSTNPPGTAPSSPEQWLHANIVTEPNGAMYLALTSNVSGEANRINVLPGSVCGANGDFSVARRLGFTDKGTSNSSYMQLDTDPNALSTIVKGDVYVDDAYFIYNDRHYLSESNSFAEARLFKTTDAHGGVVQWNNPAADRLDRFATGIRLNLNGLNHRYLDDGSLSGNEPTIIKIRQHLTDGSIYAMLESRDDTILGFEDYFDQIAYELATEVNAVHYSGHGEGAHKDTTGTAFFQHVTSRYGASLNLRVNAALAKEPSLIAASSGDGKGATKGSGDGSKALKMSQLKSAKVFGGGTDDFNSYFLKFVADIGMQGYTSNYMLETQQAVVEQIRAQRDSVMGVSTDEEMLDIIKFQQGVGAISRYMTALDDMLDRIINGMGAVGL